MKQNDSEKYMDFDFSSRYNGEKFIDADEEEFLRNSTDLPTVKRDPITYTPKEVNEELKLMYVTELSPTMLVQALNGVWKIYQNEQGDGIDSETAYQLLENLYVANKDRHRNTKFRLPPINEEIYSLEDVYFHYWDIIRNNETLMLERIDSIIYNSSDESSVDEITELLILLANKKSSIVRQVKTFKSTIKFLNKFTNTFIHKNIDLELVGAVLIKLDCDLRKFEVESPLAFVNRKKYIQKNFVYLNRKI